MAKSKFFRVAVEGATASDGRTIERNWIAEMAAGYNRATYGARVNMEHIRGYSPEPPFNAYGDVLAVRAQEDIIAVNGKDEKRLALYAEIEPTDALVQLTKKRQKIYTSIEVAPNFASTGKAGLVGLAVTDSPASLATEVLSFSTTADNAAAAAIKAGLDSRKQDKDNLFSAATETTIELVADASADDAAATGLFNLIQAAFAKFSKSEPAASPAAQTAAGASPAPLDGAGGHSFTVDPAFTAAMEAFAKKADEAIGASNAGVTALTSRFDKLEALLAGAEDKTFTRPTASGGPGAVLTDC